MRVQRVTLEAPIRPLLAINCTDDTERFDITFGAGPR